MSIKVVSQVWQRLNCGGARLLIALAIADICSDDGTRIYPSIATLAAKSRQSPRTVQRQLKQFRQLGWLEIIRGIEGGRAITAHYRINQRWINGDSLSSFPDRKGDTAGKKGCQNESQRVTNRAVKGDTAMSPDPLDPSISIKDPREVVRELGADRILGLDFAKRFQRKA